MAKQKLELTWVGKDGRPRLEPRVLVAEPARSYGDPGAENMLIFGDNLLALKALEQDFAGKIKCIYIDPPYNTGAAFAQYDDGLEHSIWLSLIRDRLDILRNLLSRDGSLWVSLDDSEAHYFKVLADELFGRDKFIMDIAWQKRDGPPNDRALGAVHEHILVWGKEKTGNSKKTLAEDQFNLMPRTEKADAQYQVFREPDGPDQRGPFRKIDTTGNAKGGRFVQSLVFALTNPYTGEEVWPRKGTCWRHSKEEMARLQTDKRLYWGVKGTAGTPMRKLFKSEAKQGMSTPSIWADVGFNQHASAEIEDLFGEKASFETPKPEGLLRRIVNIASNPGDWVLDSFGGSGTTGAVAHKMGRRWIMAELGEHCHTHIIPRMQKVVDGTDQGGISQAVGWKGGGGFKYYRLAESLLVQDKDLSTKDHPVYVINPRYDANMLIRAICKIENFRYRNDGRLHGVSSEKRFLHVTTSLLTQGYLDSLAEDIGPDQSLLVYCSRRVRDLRLPENVEIKKIPRDLLGKCDFEEGK